jgi:ABC-type cobalamin/Fe3+-siderophores transport system ATPase subunit
MGFQSIELAGWRQFSVVKIDFHPNLTIITGTNGSGKSTILNILGQFIGVHRSYLGVPMRGRAGIRFLPSVFSFRERIASWLRPKTDPNWSDIGNVIYGNEARSTLQVPTQGQQQYNLNINNLQSVIGFHMPSHRSVVNYRPIPHLAFGGINPESAFQMLIGEVYSVFQGYRSEYSVLFRLKEILANWAAFGEGNSTLGTDEAQYKAYEGFVNILEKLLPSEIGFTGLSVRAPDIVVETRTGEFMIDALSGGLTAIIEMAALIYTRSLMPDVADGHFVVTMDEPENHLHPAIQRTILSALVETFPKVQFIVATHSPFIVSSRRDARVYALRYQELEVRDEVWAEGASKPENTPTILDHRASRVECVYLEGSDLSAPSSEILREVLGVPVTFPKWVEARLEAIVAKYRQSAFTKETINNLKHDVEEAGLAELFPDALVELGRTN